MRKLFYLFFFVISINVNGESFTQVLNEGRIWVLRYRNIDIAEPQYYKLSIGEEYIKDGMSMWNLYETRCDVDGKSLGQAAIIFEGYLIGEQEGRLFYCNNSSTSEQILFMDFSMSSGDALDFNCPVDGQPIHLEITAVSDTILAGTTDSVSRRCLYVCYNNGTPDVWVEGVGSLKYGVAFPLLFYATGGIPNLMTCMDGDVCVFSSEMSGDQSQTAIDGIATHHSPLTTPHFYDLQGRQHTNTVGKGIYIRNGWKVVR